MHCVKADLPRELTGIEIHTLSDLHIGDPMYDKKLIKERIEYIKNNANAYCILNGDLINNATKTSVSDIYSENLMPMEQLQTCVDLLEPIKDKILSICTGNHEARTYRKEGIDITRLTAAQLGIADKYAAEGALLFLRLGETSCLKETSGSGKNRKICYVIYHTHGSGGGRKEGAKAIRLADMASIVDADIYIHSHTHLPMIMKQAFYRTDVRNSTSAITDKLFVNTGATLNYGGYSQTFEFKPVGKTTPVIYLNGKRKEFSARL